MNRKLLSRKLQHSLMALSASMAVFGVLMLAGTPALPSPDLTIDSGLALSTDHVAADVTNAPASRMDVAELLPAVGIESETTAAPVRRRSPNRARSLLALPYFSFAQGLRHTGS